jgi:hypothetical protein
VIAVKNTLVIQWRLSERFSGLFPKLNLHW